MENESQSKYIGKNLVHSIKFFKLILGAHFDLAVVTGCAGASEQGLGYQRSNQPSEMTPALTGRLASWNICVC